MGEEVDGWGILIKKAGTTTQHYKQNVKLGSNLLDLKIFGKYQVLESL